VSRDQGLPDEEVLVALNRAAMSARLMSGAVHEVNNALQVMPVPSSCRNSVALHRRSRSRSIDQAPG
jgi:hypothetical protein